MNAVALSLSYENYDLLLSDDPCEIFRFYSVKEMHGLNLADCQVYPNSSEDAYIAGWCNLAPSGKPFVFINISRCTNDIETTVLVMHEMYHLFNMLKTGEENIISAAEEETRKVVDLINQIKQL